MVWREVKKEEGLYRLLKIVCDRKRTFFNPLHNDTYSAIEAMTFGDRNVDITSEKRKVIAEFTTAGVTHSDVTEIALVNNQQTGIATIPKKNQLTMLYSKKY